MLNSKSHFATRGEEVSSIMKTNPLHAEKMH